MAVPPSTDFVHRVRVRVLRLAAAILVRIHVEQTTIAVQPEFVTEGMGRTGWHGVHPMPK